MTVSADAPRGSAAVVQARLAVLATFALAGVAFSVFASRIPDVKDALELTPGQLGVTLMAISAGSVTGMPAAGFVSSRIGASRTVLVGMVIGFAGLVTVGAGVDLFSSRAVTMIGLYFTGLGIGTWDVAMNVEGTVVERLWGRSVMPHFHAAFSAGTVISALIGAALSAAEVPVLAHTSVAVLLTLAAMIGYAYPRYLPRATEALAEDPPDARVEIPASRSPWLEPRTLVIGLVVLAAAFTEGVANDWLAVAMVKGHGLPNWAGVLGFAVFLTFMTIGRVLGTGLLDRYGRVAVLRVLFTTAVVGSAMVIFGNAPFAFAGAALWGIGASLGFPVGMSAGGDDPARAGARISVVATIGYIAFLAGPPLLGFLGDHVGVLKSLTVVGAMSLFALLIVPAVREPHSPSTTPSPRTPPLSTEPR